MIKYKRSDRYRGRRAWFKRFDIKNPASPAWRQAGGRPKVTGPPTEECFDDDARWYAVKDNQLVRVTGEPEDKPSYVVLDKRKDDMEMRLYRLGRAYFFIQVYYSIGKEFISVEYTDRGRALRAYSLGDIRWRLSRPLTVKLISGGD